MEFKHISIMLNECMDALDIKSNGTYVDGTLGGAGHSEKIVQQIFPNGRLIGIDKDEEALSASKKRLKEYEKCVTFVNDDFKNYKNIINNLDLKEIDGVLLDLGISSYQIDNAERGFSYMKDAPLDMRMNKTQELTARKVVNEYSPAELVKILFTFGEESFTRPIVKEIVRRREIKPIETTMELADIIKNVVPKKFQIKRGNPAKKTFQAIRIEVNSELLNLAECVEDMAKSLKVGGRLAIITFHSLEDRIVKNIFKKLQNPCECPPNFPICVCGKTQVVKILTKKPIIPSKEEVEENPRSRSAKLRVIEKI